MAKRYRRMSSVLIHRIGSFLKRLFGFKSKGQYLDDEKIKETEQSEEILNESNFPNENQVDAVIEDVEQSDSINESENEELEDSSEEELDEDDMVEDMGYSND